MLELWSRVGARDCAKGLCYVKYFWNAISLPTSGGSRGASVEDGVGSGLFVVGFWRLGILEEIGE